MVYEINQNIRPYMAEKQMMTVCELVMTESVKIVKLREVKQLLFNTLTSNDDNYTQKKTRTHT